jgi:hypothetical protein
MAVLNNGPATVDRAQFAIRNCGRRGVLVTASRVGLFLPHAPRNKLVRRPLRHSHGGTGCGSAHRPFLASRASCSRP